MGQVEGNGDAGHSIRSEPFIRDPDMWPEITVARITRRKGHHLTLAALSQLSENLRQRITWLVIGPDGEADYVDDLRQAAGQAACDIRFLGPQPNEAIRDLYAASDFFCLTGLLDTTGRVEGFGLVYLEAGAAGLPSIATEVGGVPDAVLADETGILVPPSVESISQAIAELAADGACAPFSRQVPPPTPAPFHGNDARRPPMAWPMPAAGRPRPAPWEQWHEVFGRDRDAAGARDRCGAGG